MDDRGAWVLSCYHRMINKTPIDISKHTSTRAHKKLFTSCHFNSSPGAYNIAQKKERTLNHTMTSPVLQPKTTRIFAQLHTRAALQEQRDHNNDWAGCENVAGSTGILPPLPILPIHHWPCVSVVHVNSFSIQLGHSTTGWSARKPPLCTIGYFIMDSNEMHMCKHIVFVNHVSQF